MLSCKIILVEKYIFDIVCKKSFIIIIIIIVYLSTSTLSIEVRSYILRRSKEINELCNLSGDIARERIFCVSN